jgi:hypothetical protein
MADIYRHSRCILHHFPITRRFEVYKCRRSSEIGLT